MSVLANRKALKSVSDYVIDVQFVQKMGTTLFGYQGEITKDYKDLCAQLSAVVEDSLESLKQIKKAIPSFNQE